MAPSLISSLLLCASALPLTSSHGRLRMPAGRSSLWREGFKAARNYQDNELNCGGRWYQWEVKDGKCGVCGDPWDKPQKNQPPGIYARPILAQCYDSGSNEYLATHVQLTANHRGSMQFRLCVNNDFTKPVTQDCLDQHVLDIWSESGKFIGKTLMLRDIRLMDVRVKLQIPENLTCSQCVLQWRYITANSWGCSMVNTRRRCAIGLGGQETFWACADIAIVPNCNNIPGFDSSSVGQSPTSSQTSVADDKRTRADSVEPAGNLRCVALGFWSGQPHMAKWCQFNCGSGFCPKEMCFCSTN